MDCERKKGLYRNLPEKKKKRSLSRSPTFCVVRDVERLIKPPRFVTPPLFVPSSNAPQQKNAVFFFRTNEKTQGTQHWPMTNASVLLPKLALNVRSLQWRHPTRTNSSPSVTPLLQRGCGKDLGLIPPEIEHTTPEI